MSGPLFYVARGAELDQIYATVEECLTHIHKRIEADKKSNPLLQPCYKILVDLGDKYSFSPPY